MERISMYILSLCLAVFRFADASPHSRRIHDCDSGHPADVIFVLDASNSIWRPDFRRQIEFVKEISGMFRIGPNNTQVAVITYAVFPQFQFHLNDYPTKAGVLAAMDGVRQMGGYHTSTPDALRAMRERGFGARSGGGRANVTRVGIVITDGKSDDPVKTEAEARRARDAGIHLFSVGVGLDLDLQELEKIASVPSSYYTFMVESYSGLENIKDLLAIKACTVTDPPTTTTTTTTVATTQSTPTTTPTTTTSSSAEVNEDDAHRKSEGHGKTGEMESTENKGQSQQEWKRKGGEGEESQVSADEKRRKHHGVSYETSGHEDDFEQEQTIKRTNRTNESSDSGKPFEWNDVRQNGHWGYDKHGKRIWITEESRQEETRHGSKEEEEDGRSNKTQEADGFDSQDYQVLPGDTHHGHSKKNHSSKKKTEKNDSKAKNPTSSNELSVCRPKTPLDVVFVVDAKTGDRRGDRRMLEAVRQIVEQVDMDNGLMRVQFVHSCSSARTTDHRIGHRSPIAKSMPVDDDPSDVRGSAAVTGRTSDLFETMTSKLTTNGKPGRKRVGVYLTNGPSEGDLERTLEAVQAAKSEHGVEMFTVGLGKDVNPVELRAIASCEVAKHAFTLRHQRHHSRAAKEALRHLAQSLCSIR